VTLRTLIFETAIMADRAPEPSGFEVLRTYIGANCNEILAMIRTYVWRASFDWHGKADETAQDLLSLVTLEALKTCERFDVHRDPMPWLRKIAMHMVCRKMEQQTRLGRISLETDLRSRDDEEAEELLDRLARPSADARESDQGSAEDRMDELLISLTPCERRLVRMRLKGMSYKDMAADLAPGQDPVVRARALRVQVHRLKSKMRAVGLSPNSSSESVASHPGDRDQGRPDRLQKPGGRGARGEMGG
jgi:RNA polymerase sigma factor (sigma-70 family)